MKTFIKIKKILLFSLIIFISHTIIVSALTGSGSVTVTVIPLPPTNLTSSCPSPGTSASLSWTLPSGYTLSYLRVFDNMTGGYAVLIPEWSADNGPSFSFASTPGHSYTSWVHTRLPNGASSSEIYSSFNCIPAPSGTLTASPTSCTIASGASSCNVNLTWTTTNPVGTSKITSDYPSANTTLVVINSWDNWSMAVPYSSRTFYLYNNSIRLASAPATSSCVANNTWNGSVCALNYYLVSTSAGSGGSITPASSAVNHGYTAMFTVTPNSGYSISSVSGCSGLRSGNNYATGPITAACTVTATFSLILLVPTVTTTPITSITQTTATGGGNVTSNGGSIVTGSGIVWSTSINPTTANSKTTNGWALGGPWTPTPSMVGLTPNTLYYVRAYATNPVGTSYGANVSFTTSPILLVPTVTTTPVTSSTQTTATGGGNVTSNGGTTVTVGGIVWSTSANPTTVLSTKTVNSNWADYSTWADNMTGLTTSTTYYVRAYATNSVGTAYGPNVTFPTTGPTSGTLTATGCTIPEGSSSCDTTLIWTNTTNPVGVSTIKTPNATGSILVSPATVAGTTTSTVPYPSRTFVLVNNGATLDTKTAIASCNISINHWDGSKCALNAPTATFTVNNATAATIFKGRSATLRWNSSLATSCTGTGFSTGGAITNLDPGVTVSPLITTTYTLTCTNDTGTTNDTVVTKVIIINIKEQ